MYFILLGRVFFPLQIERWFILAFTEEDIYEWNYEGGTLKGRIFSWLNYNKVIHKL